MAVMAAREADDSDGSEEADGSKEADDSNGNEEAVVVVKSAREARSSLILGRLASKN